MHILKIQKGTRDLDLVFKAQIHFGLAILLVTSSFACNAEKDTTINLENLYKTSTHVFEAVVADASFPKTSIKSSAKFIVLEQFKGSTPDTIEVAGFGSSAECKSPVTHYKGIFFAMRSKRINAQEFLFKKVIYDYDTTSNDPYSDAKKSVLLHAKSRKFRNHCLPPFP